MLLCISSIVLSLFCGILVDYILCIFFFKQKTAYEMRISDWSSDVCSSDLGQLCRHGGRGGAGRGNEGSRRSGHRPVSGGGTLWPAAGGGEYRDRKSVV